MNISEAIEFINKFPIFSLATCIDNIPYVRTMQIIKANKNELIFNVKKYKPVYSQLIENPNVQLCFYNKENGIQLRFSGQACEVFDNVIVDEIILNHPDLMNQIVKYGKDVISLFAIKEYKVYLWNTKNKEETIELQW